VTEVRPHPFRDCSTTHSGTGVSPVRAMARSLGRTCDDAVPVLAAPRQHLKVTHGRDARATAHPRATACETVSERAAPPADRSCGGHPRTQVLNGNRKAPPQDARALIQNCRTRPSPQRVFDVRRGLPPQRIRRGEPQERRPSFRLSTFHFRCQRSALLARSAHVEVVQEVVLQLFYAHVLEARFIQHTQRRLLAPRRAEPRAAVGQ